MLSKNKIKFIQSLSRKKNRDEFGLFIAEGDKLIHQLSAANFKFHTLITTDEKINSFATIKSEKITTTYSEIKKISSLKTPPDTIAICHKKKLPSISSIFADDLTIALDNLQDPGNLGTIIRLASWFGIKNIVCSNNTVDCYNAKTIQSTMGAIAYVNIIYTDLINFLNEAKQNDLIVYGTFLEGNNIYETQLQQKGIIVLGNEGNGISVEIEKEVNQKLLIPSFTQNGSNVESLNVSMAASIICSEFKRRSIK